MNEQTIAEQACSTVLTDDELSQVAGGTEGPGDPGDDNGAVDVNMKATPILF